MNTVLPRWYVTRPNVEGSGDRPSNKPEVAIDIDAFDAEGAGYRRQLVELRELLPARVGNEDWTSVLERFGDKVVFTVELDGARYFPAFYLTDDVSVDALSSVLKVLKGLPGWSQWYFFTTHDISLEDMTPLEALRNREGKRVLRAARAFVHR